MWVLDEIGKADTGTLRNKGNGSDPGNHSQSKIKEHSGYEHA